jgi:thiamine pyrophosphate-dependent acetolactate synthase large subunit-like protein
MKKYGKRLVAPERVWEYGAYAFPNLKSGVPGPVHLDFPGEVARALHRFHQAEGFLPQDQISFRVAPLSRAGRGQEGGRPHREIRAPADRRRQGVFQRQPREVLMAIAEKGDIAVSATGPMKGHFPDGHRLSINQLMR